MKSTYPSRAARLGAAVMGASLLALSLSPVAQACTRILWNGTPGTNAGAIVGRTMDWPTTTDPVLTVFPRGAVHHGGLLGGHSVVTENPATWTAKYASLVTTIYGIGAADGVNEKGLAAHLLYLNGTQMPARDPSVPGVQIGLWAQYVLDNAATVDEALAALDKIQMVMVSIDSKGRKVAGTVHLVMEDANGDSALIEYIDGKKVVHHGRDVRVVTNDPPYTQQMNILQQQVRSMALKGEDIAHPDSDTPLPGNVSPEDRLARASYFLSLMPSPKNEREGVASMLAIARNVSVPFGAPYRPQAGMPVYNTEYRTAISLKDSRYFFELTTQPSVVWAELLKVAAPPAGKVMRFDPYAPENDGVAGDITARFTPAPAPY